MSFSRLAMSGMDAAENMDRSTEVNSSDATMIDNFNKQKSIFAVDGVPQNEEGLKTLMVSNLPRYFRNTMLTIKILMTFNGHMQLLGILCHFFVLSGSSVFLLLTHYTEQRSMEVSHPIS